LIGYQSVEGGSVELVFQCLFELRHRTVFRQFGLSRLTFGDLSWSREVDRGLDDPLAKTGA
jgi:hypothetical protein